jgi:branched-subunit amino acid ABC-type transport system permease component
MDFAAVILIQVLYGIASLALISVGLAVIFGMLRVINFAHGEFLMMGGFVVVIFANAGVNIWIAILVLAPLIVGTIGLVVERLVIRHLYGRIIETVLATWGLSLFFIGLASVTVGYFQKGVVPPLGSIRIGAYSEGGYTFFVIAIALAVMAGVYLFLRHTRWGLIARGTMQDADMAAALGVARERVYAATFFAGAALSGLAGAVMVPTAGVVPTSGIAYVAKAFITVISGGGAVIAGTASAAAFLGTINQAMTILTRPVVGEAALLIAAVILLRFLPEGITGRYFRRGL